VTGVSPATRRIVTGSAEGTARIGEEIGRSLSPGAILFLTGDLGAGKTTLLQGVARGLGVRARVRSPSFTIVTRYRGPVPFTHIDLFRIRTAGEARGAGIPDLLDPDGVTAIEWAERLESLMETAAAGPWKSNLQATIRIKIRIVADCEREIVLTGSEEILSALGAALA